MQISAASVIATKRDGAALSAAQVQHFVQGLVDGGWADSQVAAPQRADSTTRICLAW